MLNKVDLLNKEFKDNWFFVVTNRNLAPAYKKFGKTFVKRTIASDILRIVKSVKKMTFEKESIKAGVSSEKKLKQAKLTPAVLKDNCSLRSLTSSKKEVNLNHRRLKHGKKTEHKQ